jgi:hypothetical protein
MMFHQILSPRAPLFHRISNAVAPASARAERLTVRFPRRRLAAFAVHESGAFMAARAIHREIFNLA